MDSRGEFRDPAVLERVRLAMDEMATALSYSRRKQAAAPLLE
ncbi:hypothetical protein [Nocardiopsis dassonvillei]